MGPLNSKCCFGFWHSVQGFCPKSAISSSLGTRNGFSELVMTLVCLGFGSGGLHKKLPWTTLDMGSPHWNLAWACMLPCLVHLSDVTNLHLGKCFAKPLAQMFVQFFVFADPASVEKSKSGTNFRHADGTFLEMRHKTTNAKATNTNTATKTASSFEEGCCHPQLGVER